MGMERYDVLVIGCVVDAEDILKPFAVEVPERSHMEERFDPKSGKKLASVKVVDEEESTEYVVDGERFKDDEKVFDYLCKKTGAMWSPLVDDGEGTRLIAIEAKSVKKGAKLEAKRMAKVCEESSQIRALFKKNWGIELEEPEIQTVETWG